jgi:isopentenyl-diphosphate delta-isomerase
MTISARNTKNLPSMDDTKEQVILVDENDDKIGLADKLDAHRRGALHRALSVFVFNDKGRMLLQKRAATKYHAAGLWANTCCSHPRSDESLSDAARRRLREEMGFDCEIKEAFSFIYKVRLDNGLWEHEFLHVFIGIWGGGVSPNPEEVQKIRWEDVAAIQDEMKHSPEIFAPWFPLSFEKAVMAFTLNKAEV